MPLAIYHRLNLLADCAAGANASRAEIIGMLVANADLEPAKLDRDLIAYRYKTVGDVVPDSEQHDGRSRAVGKVVSIQPRSPGRPAKSGHPPQR